MVDIILVNGAIFISTNVIYLSIFLWFQSIFSFNGADVSGFDSFRRDYPNHKEVIFFTYLNTIIFKEFLIIRNCHEVWFMNIP